MKIGPKYKIARRLGAAVFEKTQSPKFALSEQKRKKTFVRALTYHQHKESNNRIQITLFWQSF